MARKDYLNDPDAPTPTNIVIACSAYIERDGQILMIRRTDNDLYAIPGGTHELGETMTQTVVREVKEETGVDIEVTGLIGIYSDPAHVIAYTDGEVRQEFSICFRARATGGELRESDESKEVLWVAPDKLDDLRMHPSIRMRVEHAQANGEPFFT
ncbi:NUDIX domain-containing protein [Actinokineospora auranticolor]|uniref:ADP-ribose pyrophosphatase YjhB (NUDIX family) n=1 Tax=Actinokineospora auranticolor TaxID=155976 RepID=A0A2S6GH48_9PSEU|nr:NUDIX domain-containing protein [Actinokineospora auranticolor]PPK64466.1 ADP-ribose pyrophosphatase YjhB (NUDIX family) [Actinokineospora auranticolor]